MLIRVEAVVSLEIQSAVLEKRVRRYWGIEEGQKKEREVDQPAGYYDKLAIPFEHTEFR